MVPERMAADAASSLSNTRAGTRKLLDVVAGYFDDRPVRREVAFEDHQAAGRLDRVRERPHDLLPGCLDRVARVVADGPAGHGDGVSLEQAGVGQALHDERDAACTVQVGGDEAAAGLQVGQQRDLRADAIEVVDVERHARFVGNREQMQDRVGRAAGRRDGGDGVLDARRA